MRLSLIFDEGPGSPGMGDGSNDRLCARVDMDVLDNNPLFSAATELFQRVHVEQGLKAKPCK